MTDEYEDLDQLKKELAGRQEEGVSNDELFAAVKALSVQIQQLTEVFKIAIGQMTSEDDVMMKVTSQLDMLIKNDQDLARGLLLVLEIEKDRKELSLDQPMPLRRPLRRRFRPRERPDMMGMAPSAPPVPAPPSPEEMEVEFPENTVKGNQPQL